MSVDSYNTIYEQIVRQGCSEVQLMHIKTRFEGKINSNRRFGSITRLSQLLKVLHKRGEVGPGQTSILEEVALYLGKNNILDLIHSFNNMDIARNRHTPVPIINETPPTITRITNVDGKQRIYDLIANEIGQKWQDLARQLKVKEGKIDELYETHPRIKDRVYKILEYGQNYYANNERVWFTVLFEALGDARRNDLRKDAQTIYNTYC